MSYKEEFFDKLMENMKQLGGKLTTENNHVAPSLVNTCLFAQALHNTFKDMNDTVGMLIMIAGCDYSPIRED